MIFLMGNLLLGESIGNVFHFFGFLKQNRSWDPINKSIGRNGCTYEDQFGPTVCRCAHLDIQVSASSYRSFSSFPHGEILIVVLFVSGLDMDDISMHFHDEVPSILDHYHYFVTF